ncbi:hypothetical protein Pint_32922 [Pistacia integerrima]|uniref:Uncharacterized protein n=1 Tax=Pistacia integerrima TaxID=434235 RepID=A0ACC0X8G5_9ROSI|nr:hypothetical protein Pint_32922 [Pistacia integerrima]
MQTLLQQPTATLCQSSIKDFNTSAIILQLLSLNWYQMPLAFLGLISSLAIWDLFKFCSDKWKFDRYPVIRQVLVRIAQCGELSYLQEMATFNERT